MTNAQHQKDWRKRQKERGLVYTAFWIKPKWKQKIVELIKFLKEGKK